VVMYRVTSSLYDAGGGWILYRILLSVATRFQASTDGPSRSPSKGSGMWYTLLGGPLPGAWDVGPAWAVCRWRPWVALVWQSVPFLQIRRLVTGAFVHMHVSFLTGSPYLQYDTYCR
jgi:hypothetical protein